MGGGDSGADGDDRVAGREDGNRAELVGEPPADRAHDHRDDDEAGHPVRGVSRGEGVVGLEVGGEVDGEGDVATEGDGVEDAGLPGDRQHRVGLEPGHERRRRDGAPRGVAQDQPGGDRVDREHRGGDQERGLLADVGEELHRGERADGGAAHAGAEDADGEAAPLRREPRVDERHADREGGAGDAEEEAADQQQGVGVEGEEGDEQDRDDRDRRDDREHDPAAVAVGERTDDDPAQRADDDRDRDHQRDVGLGELTEGARLTEQRAERADERPGPEVHREADGGHGQHQAGASLRRWFGAS